MTLHRATRYALALAIVGLPGGARAQAFGLNEIGSCALARGFAVTGAPCDDGSSIYWNPARSEEQRIHRHRRRRRSPRSRRFHTGHDVRVHDLDVSTERVPQSS